MRSRSIVWVVALITAFAQAPVVPATTVAAQPDYQSKVDPKDGEDKPKVEKPNVEAPKVEEPDVEEPKPEKSGKPGDDKPKPEKSGKPGDDKPKPEKSKPESTAVGSVGLWSGRWVG